jgi:hypothetical protein
LAVPSCSWHSPYSFRPSPPQAFLVEPPSGCSKGESARAGSASSIRRAPSSISSSTQRARGAGAAFKWLPNALENFVVVGSGAFDLTKYDRSLKLLSGTFDIVVKQGTAEQNLVGTLVDVPMQTAE